MRSSANHLKDFLESVMWQDIEEELDGWIEGAQEQLESCNDTTEMFRFQGRIQAVRDMLILPSNMLDTMIEEIEENKKGEQNGKT